jgi:hypothetical protein
VRAERKALYEKPEVMYGDKMTVLPGDAEFTHLRKTEDIEREKAEREGKKGDGETKDGAKEGEAKKDEGDESKSK